MGRRDAQHVRHTAAQIEDRDAGADGRSLARCGIVGLVAGLPLHLVAADAGHRVPTRHELTLARRDGEVHGHTRRIGEGRAGPLGRRGAVVGAHAGGNHANGDRRSGREAHDRIGGIGRRRLATQGVRQSAGLPLHLVAVGVRRRCPTHGQRARAGRHRDAAWRARRGRFRCAGALGGSGAVRRVRAPGDHAHGVARAGNEVRNGVAGSGRARFARRVVVLAARLPLHDVGIGVGGCLPRHGQRVHRGRHRQAGGLAGCCRRGRATAFQRRCAVCGVGARGKHLHAVAVARCQARDGIAGHAAGRGSLARRVVHL